MEEICGQSVLVRSCSHHPVSPGEGYFYCGEIRMHDSTIFSKIYTCSSIVLFWFRSCAESGSRVQSPMPQPGATGRWFGPQVVALEQLFKCVRLARLFIVLLPRLTSLYHPLRPIERKNSLFVSYSGFVSCYVVNEQRRECSGYGPGLSVGQSSPGSTIQTNAEEHPFTSVELRGQPWSFLRIKSATHFVRVASIRIIFNPFFEEHSALWLHISYVTLCPSVRQGQRVDLCS